MSNVEEHEQTNYVWSTYDPLGNNVVLRQDTFETHFLSDTRNPKDLEQRKQLADKAKGVIENPRYIVRDKDYNINKRENYIDILYLEDRQKISFISVVAETDRDPREVVTAIAKRKIEKEGEGNIVYDSNSDRQSER